MEFELQTVNGSRSGPQLYQREMSGLENDTVMGTRECVNIALTAVGLIIAAMGRILR